MTWFWNLRENKYIKKVKQGIVFYTKPNKNKYQEEIKQNKLDRRLETKRVRTHTKK